MGMNEHPGAWTMTMWRVYDPDWDYDTGWVDIDAPIHLDNESWLMPVDPQTVTLS